MLRNSLEASSSFPTTSDVKDSSFSLVTSSFSPDFIFRTQHWSAYPSEETRYP